jgi:hypothetical protein
MQNAVVPVVRDGASASRELDGVIAICMATYSTFGRWVHLVELLREGICPSATQGSTVAGG